MRYHPATSELEVGLRMGSGRDWGKDVWFQCLVEACCAVSLLVRLVDERGGSNGLPSETDVQHPSP